MFFDNQIANNIESCGSMNEWANIKKSKSKKLLRVLLVNRATRVSLTCVLGVRSSYKGRTVDA
jgi:hypothetical protein